MNNSSAEDIHSQKNQLLNDIILWISVSTTLGVILSVLRVFVIGWKPLMGVHCILLVSLWSLWLGRRWFSYHTRIIGLLGLLWIASVGGLMQFGPLGVAGILVVSFSFIAILFLGGRLAWWLIASNILSLILIGVAASRHWLEFDLDYQVYAHHPITWVNTIWTFFSYSLIFALFGWRLLDWLLDRDQIIRQEEEKFRLAFNNANTGMCLVDMQGKLLQVNDKMCAIFGYSKHELESMTVNDLALSEDAQLSPTFIHQAIQGDKDSDTFEKHYRHRLGQIIHGQVSSSLVRDTTGLPQYFISHVQDITERKKAETELQQYRERLEETVEARTNELLVANEKLRDTVFALESVGTAIFWAEVDTGKLLSVNQHDAEMLGYEPSEMLELTVSDIDVNVSTEKYPEIAKEIREKRFLRFDTTHRRKDGTLVPVEMTVYFQEGDAKSPARFIGFGVDITERKAVDLALREAKQAAEAASEAKSLFLANMSHEIRTPLSAILGFTDLGLESEPPERLRGYLTKTKAASSHLFGLVNNILDFSKIEAGMLTLETLEFNLDQILDNLGLIMGDKAAHFSSELVFDGDADLPQRLIGDPLRLSQILMNLVDNAIKFSDQGTVVVSFRAESSEERSLILRVAVSDEGCGLSSEQQAMLFSPFHQLDTTSTRRYGGTGLGLTISKRLVEMMGGHLWVDSELGHGSTFQFTIKLNVADGGSPVGSPLNPHTGRRVLVIDDNLAVRHAIEGQIRHLGMVAETYSSWAEASKENNAENAPYLFLLIDEELPEFQSGSPLREWAGKTGLPLIPLSTYHKHEEIADTLLKPVTMTRLQERMIKLVGKEASAETDPAEPAVTVDAATLARSLRNVDILLVEDTEINGEMMVELLSNLGLSVRWAVNGLEALREADAKPPYAVLMDCQMPVMDGYEATRRLRAQERFANLPIIALTAHALSSDRDNCLAAGMNDYLSKPVDLTELIRVLIRHVKPDAPIPISSAFPKSVPSDSFPTTLPGINLTMGLSRANQNQALYFRLLGKFKDSYCQNFEADFHGAMESGDWQTAQRLAHSLKGTARTLGVELLGELAAQLEAAVKQAEPQAIPEPLAKLVKELKQVNVGLEGLKKV